MSRPPAPPGGTKQEVGMGPYRKWERNRTGSGNGTLQGSNKQTMSTWAPVTGSSLGTGFLGGWEATLAQEAEAEAGLSGPLEETFTVSGFTA